MTDQQPADIQPWGRIASLILAALALFGGQALALAMISSWYGMPIGSLPSVGSDGVAVSIIILVSTPVEVALLMLLAARRGNPLEYLALKIPTRGQVAFGVTALIALIIVADTVSWLAGRDLVTSFQSDITRTAGAADAMPLLWFAVVIGAPIGEEVIFRGFLFRAFLRTPHDVWPTILITAALFALLHLQYDWFVVGQILVFGVLLGWMRWASGSTLLTMLLHALINFEGMIETVLFSQ